jgi:hypothetical protein
MTFKDLKKRITLEAAQQQSRLFERLFWIWNIDNTYGIGKIYTAEEIEKAKQSPSFVFHTKDIEAAIEKGKKYNPDDFNPYYFT